MGRPGLQTDPRLLLQPGHHHDGAGPLLPDHPPEITQGLRQGPLCSNIGILLPVAVYIVGVDVVAARDSCRRGGKLKKTSSDWAKYQWALFIINNQRHKSEFKWETVFLKHHWGVGTAWGQCLAEGPWDIWTFTTTFASLEHPDWARVSMLQVPCTGAGVVCLTVTHRPWWTGWLWSGRRR